MFKISPIQTKEEQKKCAEITGAQYIESCFAYSMRDSGSGELMGFSQFDISGGCGHLYDLRPIPNSDDFEAMFILARATMSFIDTCGAHVCTAPITAGDPALMRAVGFKEEDGKYFADMTHFFDGSCHSGK